jgi:glycerol-3-phosphate acyltransferase PlsY
VKTAQDRGIPSRKMEVTLPSVIIALVGYLLGSIPFGYLVGRAKGVDIRQHGSGNIGATNVLRTLGRGPGVFVFVCDALKGLAAVQFATLLTHHTSAEIIAAVCCILGHNFPCWLRFKGGKGIATSTGALIGMLPLATLIGAAVWAGVFFSTRFVSLASIVAAFSLPITVGLLIKFMHHGDRTLFYFSIVIALLAIWRHWANIQRLLRGTENRFVKSK